MVDIDIIVVIFVKFLLFIMGGIICFMLEFVWENLEFG